MPAEKKWEGSRDRLPHFHYAVQRAMLEFERSMMAQGYEMAETYTTTLTDHDLRRRRIGSKQGLSVKLDINFPKGMDPAYE